MIIWIGLILSIIFSKVTIINSLNELSIGLKNITKGNFSKRIKLEFAGELRELILRFNEMAKRLEFFEEQKEKKLLNEKLKLKSFLTTIADRTITLDTNLKKYN